MKLLTILLALASIEGISWWWMHPAPTGQDQPVLVYRPSRSAGVSPAVDEETLNRGRGTGDSEQGTGDREERFGIVDRGSKIVDEKITPASSFSSDQQSKIHNHQSSISSSSPDHSSSAPTHTSLPELVARAIPTLHCSTGTAFRIDREDGVTIHTAFFEWDLADTTSVLEAFKHLPDECMGSIGMTLTAHRPVRSCPVGNETLSFDHTVFRDPQGEIIHAFKGVWVSGASSLLGDGVRGGGEQWNQLRWKAALKRFRPAHARVAQGAVRGIPSPDLAWEAFESTMLADLRFDTQK